MVDLSVGWAALQHLRLGRRCMCMCVLCVGVVCAAACVRLASVVVCVCAPAALSARSPAISLARRARPSLVRSCVVLCSRSRCGFRACVVVRLVSVCAAERAARAWGWPPELSCHWACSMCWMHALPHRLWRAGVGGKVVPAIRHGLPAGVLDSTTGPHVPSTAVLAGFGAKRVYTETTLGG